MYDFASDVQHLGDALLSKSQLLNAQSDGKIGPLFLPRTEPSFLLTW